MATLWEEWILRRSGSDLFDTFAEYEAYLNGGYGALHDYADYEIVEGVLTTTGSYVGVMEMGFYHPHIIGQLGDHVKLLVPPRTERPEPSSREKRLEAALTRIVQYHQRSTLGSFAYDIASRALEESA